MGVSVQTASSWRVFKRYDGYSSIGLTILPEKRLGKRIEMRRIPEMTFKDDTVLEKGLSVLKLLEELKNKTQNQDSTVEENNANSWAPFASKKNNSYSIKR